MWDENVKGFFRGVNAILWDLVEMLWDFVEILWDFMGFSRIFMGFYGIYAFQCWNAMGLNLTLKFS